MRKSKKPTLNRSVSAASFSILRITWKNERVEKRRGGGGGGGGLRGCYPFCLLCIHSYWHPLRRFPSLPSHLTRTFTHSNAHTAAPYSTSPSRLHLSRSSSSSSLPLSPKSHKRLSPQLRKGYPSSPEQDLGSRRTFSDQLRSYGSCGGVLDER